MKYSIDTSAILEAWVRYYPPDVMPGLWKKLEELIQCGDLIASSEVRVELEKKEDDAFKWAKKNNEMFREIDNDTQLAVRDILRDHRRLVDTRKNRSMADPFVIGLARVENCKVITAEKPTNNLEKPHIPDVCNALGIECITILELCREQKWQFG
jgi:hypothetical protein